MVFGQLLGLIASPLGIFAVLLGIIFFFIVPVVGAVTRVSGPSRFMFWLAARPISRAAIAISESNDAEFKTMQFSEPGIEKITFGDEEKSFADPDGALHWWRGMRFALADEADGILFDPRHAAIGTAKRLHDQREEAVFDATEGEWSVWGVQKWLPAVFELPSQHQILDLSRVRELVQGGERAEYPQRVESFYRHSQDPFGDGASISKFFYPIIGFGIPFFGMWILSSQLGSGGGATSSVSFGLGMMGMVMGVLAGGDSDGRNWLGHLLAILRLIVLAVVSFGLPTVIVGALWLLVSPIAAVGLSLCFLFGFLLLPLLSLLLGVSETLAKSLASLFFKLGFLGFRTPVLEWTPWSYRLREASELDDVEEICWYGLFGTQVGITYAPDADAWEDGELLRPQEVRELGAAQTDGGAAETNLPPQYDPAPSVTRDIYGGFVPSRVDDDAQYLDSAVAMSRFNGSADGKMSMERLLLAKEKYGGSNGPLSDKAVLYLTAAGGLLGVILGVIFFVL